MTYKPYDIKQLDMYAWVPVSTANEPMLQYVSWRESNAWAKLIGLALGDHAPPSANAILDKWESLENEGWTVKKFKLVEAL